MLSLKIKKKYSNQKRLKSTREVVIIGGGVMGSSGTKFEMMIFPCREIFLGILFNILAAYWLRHSNIPVTVIEKGIIQKKNKNSKLE